MKKILKSLYKILYSFIGVSSIVLFPVCFIYGQNSTEIVFETLLPLMLKFLLFALFVLVFWGIMTRKLSRMVFLSIFSLILFMNFKRIENIFSLIIPAIKYWHVVTILVVVLGILFLKVKDEEVIIPLSKVVIAVFWGLILWNILPNIPVIFQKNNEVILDSTEENVDVNNSIPNIYYLIFDEYSSIEFMKKYYNYDNTALAQELEKKGFNVSYSSSNEAYVTQICMTNTMNMDFLFDMSMNNVPELTDKITEKRHNNKVFEILREHGYQIQGIGIPEFYGLPRIEGNGISEKTTMAGESIEQLLIGQTLLYPFYVPNTTDKFENIQESIRFLINMDKPITPTFTLFHIESSHTPFVMDAAGNSISGEHTMDWENKKYYEGTYKYTSYIIEQLSNSLLKKDPNSIILIQSDHSARAGDSDFVNMFEEKDKCQIFNALYYRGEILNIDGLSGINTMRFLFNLLFDMKYPMLETYPLMEVS